MNSGVFDVMSVKSGLVLVELLKLLLHVSSNWFPTVDSDSITSNSYQPHWGQIITITIIINVILSLLIPRVSDRESIILTTKQAIAAPKQ